MAVNVDAPGVSSPTGEGTGEAPYAAAARGGISEVITSTAAQLDGSAWNLGSSIDACRLRGGYAAFRRPGHSTRCAPRHWVRAYRLAFSESSTVDYDASHRSGNEERDLFSFQVSRLGDVARALIRPAERALVPHGGILGARGCVAGVWNWGSHLDARRGAWLEDAIFAVVTGRRGVMRQRC